MSTAEQRAARAALEAVAPGFSVRYDPEGWPMIIGRRHRGTGDGVGRDRLDWLGDDRVFSAYVARRTRGALTVALNVLLAITGVRRHQTGDTEARVQVEAAAVPAVLMAIHGRRRRAATGRPFPGTPRERRLPGAVLAPPAAEVGTVLRVSPPGRGDPPSSRGNGPLRGDGEL